jgi:lysophospholipase L1-like esterase
MKIFLLITLLFSALISHAQTAPFQNEIDAFKKEDSLHFPPKDAILFVGSSSFRMWSDVQNYFPGYTIVNRGFGGSTLPDVIHFAPDIIFPYYPKQVVVYCGDNDLAADTSISGKTVFERFETLYKMIREHLGKEVNVVFVSIKPSPSRENLLPKIIVANTWIEQYLSKEKNTAFVDVFHPMLDANGKMRPELYREDMLHMKPEGYAIWQKAIQPYLIK